MMSLLRFFAFLSLMTAALAAPAPAAELLRRIPPTLDPAKGYILVEIRNHDATAQPGTIILARYDPGGNDVQGGARSPDSALAGNMPVRVAVSSRPLVRGEESRLYLVALEPDIWVIEGAGGTAFSLGSRTFAIAAGEILDLGVFSPRTDWPEGEGPENLTVGRAAGMVLLGPFARRPDPRPAMLEIRERNAGDLAVPEPIRATIVPARFREGARFGNYLGGLVNRIDGRRGRPDAVPATDATPEDGSQQP